MTTVLFIAVVAIIFWLTVVDRPILKVHITKGHIDKVKGHITPSFQHNLQEIISKTPFDGQIKAYRQRTGIKIIFSSSVPKNVRQRIRNVFPFSSYNANLSRKRQNS
ncbi:DUF3634 family protein [Vibrio salinus]|uniref:DUF3634 family protein n=1 Tax=Vibrio salinus TaxID=2899784 RepID=UPI001E34D535|nr:DUF3634 family protein [Vibrio salinus]MCE0492546.1 DUF3634 family protein [Vibrio salinus]